MLERRKKLKNGEFEELFGNGSVYMFLQEHQKGTKAEKERRGEWRIKASSSKAYMKNSVDNEKFVALDREKKLFAACGYVQNKEYIWNFGLKKNEQDGTMEIDPEASYDLGM